MLNKVSIATAGPIAQTRRWALALTALVALAAAGLAEAQDDVPYSDEELQSLVGPIALYPDDLVAIVLPASTYPLQVVQAARLLDDLEDNPSLQPDPEWDDAIVALMNYPEVLRLMNEDLDWTWALGEAVLGQQPDVLDAIQDFRDQAYAAGNLRTDDRQVVTEEADVISIAPADPEVIYIPYYEPERVIVYQPRPVYHYYSAPYPVYYYPYPVGYRFRSGFFWGVTSAFAIGWHSHYVNIFHHSHISHPYYSYSYYTPYYARRGLNININVGDHGHVWHPTHRLGVRPGRDYRERITASREGYVRPTYRDQRRETLSRSVQRDGRAVERRDPRPLHGNGDTRVTRQQRINGSTARAPSGASTGQRVIDNDATRAARARAAEAAPRAPAPDARARGGVRPDARTSNGRRSLRPSDAIDRNINRAPQRETRGTGTAARMPSGQVRGETRVRPERSSSPSTLRGTARIVAPQQRSTRTQGKAAPQQGAVRPQRQTATQPRSQPQRQAALLQRPTPTRKAAPQRQAAPQQRSAPQRQAAPQRSAQPAPRARQSSGRASSRQSQPRVHSRAR